MRRIYTICNNIIASIFILSAVSNLHSACVSAEDYGIISIGTVLSGDFNSDSTIDILDIIQLVNLILGEI